MLRPVLVASGQHPTMVTQALAAFDLLPDVTLHVDRAAPAARPNCSPR